MPDVVGLSDQQAVDRLARAGLCPGIAYTVDVAGREGVTGQDPSPGVRRRVGATVHIVVATAASAAIVRGAGNCPNPFDRGTVLSR
ncbi:MAG TPA: PASTA domain-containing protein [Gaiellaceae bacterium]